MENVSLWLVEIMASNVCGLTLCMVGGGGAPKLSASDVGTAVLLLTLWADLVLCGRSGGACTGIRDATGSITRTSATCSHCQAYKTGSCGGGHWVRDHPSLSIVGREDMVRSLGDGGGGLTNVWVTYITSYCCFQSYTRSSSSLWVSNFNLWMSLLISSKGRSTG